MSQERKIPTAIWLCLASTAALSIMSLFACNETDPPGISGEAVKPSPRWVDVGQSVSPHPPMEVFSSTLVPTTSIIFTVLATGVVTLSIFDSRDILVVALLDHVQMAAGTHEVEFNAGGFASGVYVFTLRVEYADPGGTAVSFQSRKMLLVK